MGDSEKLGYVRFSGITILPINCGSLGVSVRWRPTVWFYMGENVMFDQLKERMKEKYG
jgi:hypothetical protein